MPSSEIPPAAQSVASMIDLHHQIAQAHIPRGTSIGKIISPPPDIEIAWNDIIIKKDRIYIDEYLLKGHTREAQGHIASKTQLKMCAAGDEPPVVLDSEATVPGGSGDSGGTGSIDSTTDAVTSAVSDVVTGAISGAVTDAVTSVAGGATSDDVTSAVTSAVTDAVTSAITDAVTSAVAGAATGAVADAVASAVSGAVTSAVSGAVSDAVTSAVSGAVSDAVTSAITDSVTSAVSDAITSAVTDAITSAATDAVTNAAGGAVGGQIGTCCGCIYCNKGCTHAHKIDDDYKGTLTLTDTLKEGDLVEVTPLFGDQLFIVKCKLIYLGDSDE